MIMLRPASSCVAILTDTSMTGLNILPTHVVRHRSRPISYFTSHVYADPSGSFFFL